jgi:hypothetical protein
VPKKKLSLRVGSPRSEATALTLFDAVRRVLNPFDRGIDTAAEDEPYWALG